MDYEEALEFADDLLADIGDLPDRAADFRDSVQEKVEGMREWMLEHETVTEKMVSALENIRTGVDKWLRH